MDAAAPLTLGTAGHIDHGKTALIGALTGVDTDRLAQERERGISIELGYASLELPSGRRLSVIDVPGHERFVRTMVAGATGIDLFLMVIAADDGVMPQTREHAAVLRALAVERGVVAVTKADVADPGRALEQASELLPGAPAVAVSARTGAGLDELRRAIEGVAGSLPSRALRAAPACLHVDRRFTVRGAGTVVTGTLWAGEIGRGEQLLLLPAGRPARVRGVQVHDQPLERAAAGQRVAVNLSGVARDEVERGDVLAAPDTDLAATFLIDAELEFGDREPEHGERAQVHHGTREAPARLTWLGGRFWQIRLEQPLIAGRDDRLVVRQIAPPLTLGGGRVLDPRARRHGPGRELLARLERLSRGEERSSGEPTRSEPAVARRSRSDPSPAPSAAVPLSATALELELVLREAGAEPPLDAELDAGDLGALRDAGRIVRVSRNLHFHRDALDAIRERTIALARRHGGEVTLAQLRDELATSRKFAEALLAHFDSERVTIRRGDRHVLRRRVASGE